MEVGSELPSIRDPEPLINRESLPKMSCALATHAIKELASADALQGTCFFEWRSNGASNRQGFHMVRLGLSGPSTTTAD